MPLAYLAGEKWCKLRASSPVAMEDWMNSPELKAFRKAWQEAEKQQNAEDDAWWDSLDHA